MKSRIISTLILWTATICLPLFLKEWGAFLLIFAFGVATQREVQILLGKIFPKVDQGSAIAGTVILLLGAIFIDPSNVPAMATLMLIISANLIIAFFRPSENRLQNGLFPTMIGLMLVGIPFFVTILLIHDFGLIIPIWIIAIAKFTDVGALLFGMKFGQHKMCPTISPKKTWEGLAGGLTTGVMVGMIVQAAFYDYFPPEITLLKAGLIALPIAICGVISDLIESSIKRLAKVKDSGDLIPGIGGVFDLTDSVILAVPVAYSLIWLTI